jgi:hypothetical protein
MEISGLWFRSLFETSDLVGLETALSTRLKVFERYAKRIVKDDALSPEQREQLSKLKASFRRFERTFKGLKQVTDLKISAAKHLGVFDPDRIKQEREEMRRLKIELLQVIGDFDTLMMTVARKIKIGDASSAPLQRAPQRE